MISTRYHVILVHGAGGGSWEWKLWLDHHSQCTYKYPNISLYPCHLEVFKYGRTFDTISIDDYTRQIVEFVGELSVDWCAEENRLVLLGASMGGVLITQACDYLHHQPHAMIFVCTTLPLIGPLHDRTSHDHVGTDQILPNRISYERSPLQSTIVAMPDCDLRLCEYVHRQWRDESGIILNTIYRGVQWKKYEKMRENNQTRFLAIIPADDEYISAQEQVRFAQLIKADYTVIPNLLHIGPLLSAQACDIADYVFMWLSETI